MMRGASRIVATIALGCLSLTPAAGKKVSRGAGASPPCRFVAPRALEGGVVQWVGACPAGRAEGSGMLRRRSGGTGADAFYGAMANGSPVIGVIEDQGSFRVGRFRNGDIGPSDAPQENLDAFRAATAAARVVSAQYRRAGNAPSAAYYENVARRLELQIE